MQENGDDDKDNIVSCIVFDEKEKNWKLPSRDVHYLTKCIDNSTTWKADRHKTFKTFSETVPSTGTKYRKWWIMGMSRIIFYMICKYLSHRHYQTTTPFDRLIGIYNFFSCSCGCTYKYMFFSTSAHFFRTKKIK